MAFSSMGYAVTMKIVKSALGFYLYLSFWCAGTTLHPRSQQVNPCRQCFQAQHAAGVRVFLRLLVQLCMAWHLAVLA